MSKPEYPRVGLMTDAGLSRGRPLDTVLSLDLSYGRLVVLADGAGSGESPTASEIAVDTLAKVFREQQPDFSMERAVPRFIQFAMQDANREVFKAAQLTASPDEFSASVVLSLVIDSNAYVGYCGSARMVVLRNGAATRITKDYSTVGAGSDSANKPAAARIVKPMGHDPDLSPAVFAGPIQLRTGDLFVLCADGLYDYLEDGEMGAAGESLQAEEAVVQLVNTAKERGSAGSISVVIYQTEAPAVEAVDDTEGAVVIDVEPDQSPTEPAATVASLPPPQPKRSTQPLRVPAAPAPASKPVPWLVVGAAAMAMGLIIGLLLWAPWAADPEKNDAKVADAAKSASANADKTQKGVDPAVDPEATDPVPGESGDQPKEAKAVEEPSENDPPAGGRVIEVAPPIPVGKPSEAVEPFKKGGKPVKDINKLGAPGAESPVEEPAKGEEPANSGGTQAVKDGQPADAAARIAVGPKPVDGQDGDDDGGEEPVKEVQEPVKGAKEPAKVAPVKGNEEEWPEEPGEAKKPAGGTAKHLSAAEVKKAAAAARKAEREAKKKAAAEAKKKAEAEKKAAAEAKKKAAADAKKKKELAKLTAAEAKKLAEEEKKAAAEAKKLAAAEAKKAKAAKEAKEDEDVEEPEAVVSAGGCSTKGLKGKNATAVTKTQEAVQLAKDNLKKNDAQAAAQAHVKAVWQIKHNKEAAARCTGSVDEVRIALAANYLKLTEYLAKKKQCKAARGRAKDAAMFGATDAQRKKALGDCFIGSSSDSDSDDDPAPAPAPKKPAAKPAAKPASKPAEDLEP